MRQIEGDVLHPVRFGVVLAANDVAFGNTLPVLGPEPVKRRVRLRGGGFDFHRANLMFLGQ